MNAVVFAAERTDNSGRTSRAATNRGIAVKHLHARAVVTDDDVRRLGPIGAFDWATLQMRDAIADGNPGRSHGYHLELWVTADEDREN